MKKRLAVLLSIIFTASMGYCAQPHSQGSVSVSKIVITPIASATIGALTPDATGQLVICSDCTNANTGKLSICLSTGIFTAGAFMIVSSATAVTACR